MMLLVDIGNTALKWQWLGKPASTVTAVYHQSRWSEAMLQVLSECGRAPEQISICSVAGKDNDQHLAARVEQVVGVRPQFFYSCKRQLDVENAYVEPGQLGADRWLAIIESYCQYGASLIVDAGSALTIDMVDASGRHQGGYIVPGIAMQYQSLFGATADVKGRVLLGRRHFGNSTEACVNNGIWQMTVGLVSSALDDARKFCETNVSLVLTGGDHVKLAGQFERAVSCPNLVLDGLARVAKETLK